MTEPSSSGPTIEIDVSEFEYSPYRNRRMSSGIVTEPYLEAIESLKRKEFDLIGLHHISKIIKQGRFPLIFNRNPTNSFITRGTVIYQPGRIGGRLTAMSLVNDRFAHQRKLIKIIISKKLLFSLNFQDLTLSLFI